MNADTPTVSHTGEPILGECPRCRLPIYQSDPRDVLYDLHKREATAYHAGCAWKVRIERQQDLATEAVRELRNLGCTVRFEIVIPT